MKQEPQTTEEIPNGNMELRQYSMEYENSQNKEKSSQLITNEPIGKTPFRLIGVANKYFVAYGKSRVSETFETKEEAINLVLEMDWGLLLCVILVIIENIEKDKLPGESTEQMMLRKMNE